jgi:hypothetical protein
MTEGAIDLETSVFAAGLNRLIATGTGKCEIAHLDL